MNKNVPVAHDACFPAGFLAGLKSCHCYWLQYRQCRSQYISKNLF